MNIVRADSGIIDHALVSGSLAMRAQSRLEATGISVSRHGLVVVLLLIGVLKFTPVVLSVQGVSDLIGAIEIAIAALIALRPFSPRASCVGSLGAVVTFLLTVSFLFSTPGGQAGLSEK
jgi:reactive chlorine resistance protein C